MDDILPEIRDTVDLQRFAGRWYEVERSQGIPFEPDGTTDVRAIYSWDGRTFGIRNEALLNGRPIYWETRVKRIVNAYNSRFVIEVPLPPGARTVAGPREGIYRILMLDMRDYQWAVVASGERENWIWVLSRERLMTRQQWDTIHAVLEDHFGVDLRTLVYTAHTRKDDDDDDDGDRLVHADTRAPAPVVALGDGEYAVGIGKR